MDKQSFEALIRNHDYLILGKDVWVDDSTLICWSVLEFFLKKYRKKILISERRYQKIQNGEHIERGQKKNRKKSVAELYLERFVNRGFVIIEPDIPDDSESEEIKIIIQKYSMEKNTWKRICLITDDPILRIQVKQFFYDSKKIGMAISPKEIELYGQINLRRIIEECEAVWIETPVWENSGKSGNKIELFPALISCLENKGKKIVLSKQQLRKIYDEFLENLNSNPKQHRLAVSRIEKCREKGFLEVKEYPCNFQNSENKQERTKNTDFLQHLADEKYMLCILTKDVKSRRFFEEKLGTVKTNLLIIQSSFVKQIEDNPEPVEFGIWNFDKITKKNDLIVLDSDIWMDVNQDVFFNELRFLLKKLKRLSLAMPTAQFDDLCIKKRDSKFEDELSVKSRTAIGRIESLQSNPRFILPLSKEPKEVISLQEEISRFLNKEIERGLRVCFISQNPYSRMAIWEALTKMGAPKEAFEVLDFWGYDNLFSNDRTVSEKDHFQQDIGESYSLEGLVKGSYYVHIDSNIWMDKDVETFFQNLERFLQKYKKTLVIPNYQFGELWKIKERNSQSEENQEERSFKVELALERIERLQNRRLLEIEEIKFNLGKDVYADPQIIRTLEQKAENGEKVALITNDVELRIRTRSILRGKGFPHIVGGIPRWNTKSELREYERKKPETAVSKTIGLLLGTVTALFLSNYVKSAITMFVLLLIFVYGNSSKIKTKNLSKILVKACIDCIVILILISLFKEYKNEITNILKTILNVIWHIIVYGLIILFIVIGLKGANSSDD